MKFARTLLFLCSVFALSIVLSGCVSPEKYAEERRQRLLAANPPGKTTRTDVQKRWRSQPDVSETRPASGWSASEDCAVREHTTASEQRTGQMVCRCERYSGPDGWSGGLCYGWFYYDNRDYVVDAEWQWHTD
jgi:hypothetical protein